MSLSCIKANIQINGLRSRRTIVNTASTIGLISLLTSFRRRRACLHSLLCENIFIILKDSKEKKSQADLKIFNANIQTLSRYLITIIESHESNDDTCLKKAMDQESKPTNHPKTDEISNFKNEKQIAYFAIEL